MNVQTFRKKPVEIEAMKVARPLTVVAEWCGGAILRGGHYGTAHVGVVATVEGGTMIALLGDWIVLDEGKFSQMSAAEFEATFEAVRPGGEPA
jgi:hypothetical protein